MGDGEEGSRDGGVQVDDGVIIGVSNADVPSTEDGDERATAKRKVLREGQHTGVGRRFNH